MLFNYYVAFNLSNQNVAQVAFIETTYTYTSVGLTIGAVMFLILIGIILMGGVIGGILVYMRNKREKEILVTRRRNETLLPARQQVEEEDDQDEGDEGDELNTNQTPYTVSS